jgi:putative SOS response-associated peptidase YedK
MFGAVNATAGSNRGEHVYPGYPGLVVADGEVRQLIWGFPLAQKSKNTAQPLKPKPVNNARTDKLDSFMWRFSFLERRCLIPVTGFAEAEGEKGATTRTWIAVPGQEMFACAGIWRDSPEWGPVYSMVMTDPCPSTAEVHDRMPVILAPRDCLTWIAGAPEEALALCRPWDGECAIDRTAEPWFQRRVG